MNRPGSDGDSDPLPGLSVPLFLQGLHMNTNRWDIRTPLHECHKPQVVRADNLGH
jgi:hypothetical protein